MQIPAAQSKQIAYKGLIISVGDRTPTKRTTDDSEQLHHNEKTGKGQVPYAEEGTGTSGSHYGFSGLRER